MQQLLRFSLAFLVLSVLTNCGRPIAKLEAPREVRAGDPVSFTNASEDAVRYEWDFGDGNNSESTNPEHRFLRSGDYRVTLTAYNEKGKRKSTTENISVMPPSRCLVQIETTEGNMIAELFDQTPQHQDNFVKLVEEQFYDSLLFHRVIRNFMIQGGDPNSRNAGPSARLGTGGPGYTVPAEFNPNFVHVKGALAAARAPDNVNPEKASSGSQFYIVHGRSVSETQLNQQEGRAGFRYSTENRERYAEMGGYPALDGNYTVFGQVIEGLDVIDRIATTTTRPGDRPTKDMWMRIRLIR